MGGSGFMGLGPDPSGPKYGSTQELVNAAAKAAPPKPDLTIPTPENSKATLDESAAAQAKAKGAKATLFAGRSGFMGGSGPLSSGSAVSQRMLLGS